MALTSAQNPPGDSGSSEVTTLLGRGSEFEGKLSFEGTVRVDGVRGPIKASVQAGTARLDGFEGPLDLEVQAGSIRGEGRLASGHSRVRGEAGSIRLKLKDSSVRINGRSALGTIQVDGSSMALTVALVYVAVLVVTIPPALRAARLPAIEALRLED